jgi:tetratricopeptide (TPR) repeat protein
MDDAVPEGSSGWLARLQAAKNAGLIVPEDAQEEEGKETAPKPNNGTGGPPPLKKQPGKTKKKLEGKPAHLLVAELEAEEKKRKEARRAKRRDASQVGEEESNSIAEFEVAKPQAKISHKRMPLWAGLIILVVAIGASVGFGVWKGEQDPVKAKVELDPMLMAARKRLADAIAARDMGHEAARQGKSEAAIKAYTKALELKPDMAAAERGLAVAHAAKGDRDRAVRHYKRYLKLDPAAADAGKVRGIIKKAEAQKQREEADKKKAEERKRKRRRRRR